MQWHDDTVGEIEWDGRTYQIDWPREMGGSERDIFAAVYEDGIQVGEFANPDFPYGQGFRDVEHVMDLAFEFITGGGLEE